MTQEIIEMAEGCGFTRTHTGEVELWLCNKNDLERLVKLLAAKEREECALIGDGFHDAEANCGDLIRARGQA